MMREGGFIESFGPYAANVATMAARMIEFGLGPEDVLRLYDEYMERLAADMILATPEDQARAAGLEPAPADPGDVRQTAGQADREFRLGACPQCGAEVWGIKKCPHIAPPWRTFFACDGENCGFHGKSRLTVEQLRRKWPEGAEVE